MLIDLFTHPGGSPNGLIPADIHERGIGGAELAMITWSQVMAERGHEVRIYNDPRQPGEHDGVLYRARREFEPLKNRDVFITFRSPTTQTSKAQAGIKLHWSCDQQTAGNYRTDIVPYVDKIVCISPYHLNYYSERYGVSPPKIGYFDLGVRLDDYDIDPPPERRSNRFIFCSVPMRGLAVVHHLWPSIKEALPEAELAITADYRLWGAPTAGDEAFRLDFVNSPGVEYHGMLSRNMLIEEQLTAAIHLYPCTYDELFCISAAECQVAGAWPITSDEGSLPTTNEFGTVFTFPGQKIGTHIWREKYVEALLSTVKMIGEDERLEMRSRARERFDWHVICSQWEHLIETGEFPHVD